MNAGESIVKALADLVSGEGLQVTETCLLTMSSLGENYWGLHGPL